MVAAVVFVVVRGDGSGGGGGGGEGAAVGGVCSGVYCALARKAHTASPIMITASP